MKFGRMDRQYQITIVHLIDFIRTLYPEADQIGSGQFQPDTRLTTVMVCFKD